MSEFGPYIKTKSYQTAAEWLDAPCKDGTVTVGQRLCFLAHAARSLQPSEGAIVDKYPNGHQRGLTEEQREELRTLVEFMALVQTRAPRYEPDKHVFSLFQKRLDAYTVTQRQECLEVTTRDDRRRAALQRVVERIRGLSDEEFFAKLKEYENDAIAYAMKGMGNDTN